MIGVPATILNRKALTSLVKGHSAFEKSIFLKHPTMLRKYGELRVRRIASTNTSDHFYFLLTFPVLSEKDFYPSYSIHQTGFISNDSCHELDLPDRVVLKEDRWYKVKCRSNHLQGICPIKMGSSIREVSCFEGKDPNCFAPQRKCEQYSYVNSEHGVLITTTHQVLGSPIDIGQPSPKAKHDQLEAFNASSTKTMYIPWLNFSSVKILIELNEKEQFMMRTIEPPDSSWNRFVERINLKDGLGTNVSEISHLKALSSIAFKNIDLRRELKTELAIVHNISSNPEEYERTVKTSSIMSYVATALSSGVVLVVLVKIFQCVAARYAPSCFGSDRSNRCISG